MTDVIEKTEITEKAYLAEKRPDLEEFGKNKLAVSGLMLIAVLCILALFAPEIAPHDPFAQKLDRRLLSPSSEYPFGTDELGRCIFSRVIYGTRISLGIGLLVVAVTSVAGTAIGLTSGYRGGLLDEVLMRGVDIVMAFPNIILALLIAGLLGPGFSSVVLALAFTQWPAYARLVRGQALSLRKRAFVEAARALRPSGFYIMRKHILPNCMEPIIVLGTLEIAHVIIFASALSFLGLGIQPPVPEWGSMLKAGIPYLRTAPHLTFFPGLMIIFTVFAFNFAGDGLRDSLGQPADQEVLAR
ncbi:Dipeptide transport system permease protein DppC [Methanosarcina horonobensis HB-1 = JCM 15518]|uniref:Dipeptide transport system permease protein DppC n=1 Tax=Methanosarcina horonobensis HB-1 = JCM 15518 TaxID=1434110 RepID=A0A0E3SEA1_9EURY|nr:nickel ABC transporter permease subunit NikC [Methanosarcina horonobensis]AKB79226.1 Dipeptide transport system permease protein DppC [Methanosarcina horonobensis HB-1 = JCM 15518]